MPLSVEMEFDQDTDEMIRAIWKQMSDNGISTFLHNSSSIPHITLCVYEDIKDEAAFIENVRTFEKKISMPKVDITGVGVFGGEKHVIYLTVTVTEALLKLHRDFFAHMEAFSEQSWEQYRPGRWIPHATVAMQPLPERVHEGVKIALDLLKPMSARVETIGIIHVKPLKYLEYIVIKEQ